ncbi:hypothetical protein L3X38_040096 [Prunus dulcis]|uniref:TF-B3 domain-containing protein n=1 Tax=Prunus dulcis TaxID=3755 RepID=A0AAD4V8T1_PRUDU|nr:hypothetical protein L3X38_040096 [Prunus dulcis]
MASREDREDPGYGDGKMTSSTEEGAYLLLHLKHTILNPETARNLEHMKSKILSGIKLKSPSGSKRKALRIQEPEAPQAGEATNGAARRRSLPRELQFQQQERRGLFYGNYTPPDLPPIPSLQNLIQDCSKPFEKQLARSDVKDNQCRLSVNKEDVENNIMPLLRNSENLNEGIDVTTYDMAGNEYPMVFKIWATKVHVLTGGWKTFCNDLGLVENQDFVTLWIFRHVDNGGLCFAIHSRRLLVFEPIKKKRPIRQNYH